MDYQLLLRDYEKVIELIANNEDPYFHITKQKAQLLLQISDEKPLLPDNTLSDPLFRDNYRCDNLLVMDIESAKYQLLNFMKDDKEITKQVFESELTYDTFEPYLKQLSKLPKNEISRQVSWLEVIYKLIQSPKQKKSHKFQTYNELMRWQQYFIQIVMDIQQNQDYYSILRKPLKELYRLSLVQILSLIDHQIEKYFEQLFHLINNKLTDLYLDSSIRITILYSFARILLPKLDSNDPLPQKNSEILTILICHDKINQVPKFKTWLELFEYLMFLMLSEINLKKEHIFQKKLEDKIKKEQPDIPFIDQLWYYVSVNFTQQNIKLNQSLKSLISHNVYALVNIYCVKYNRFQLMNQILEDLLITPFEDDILRMNMCIILFNSDDFSKLHQMVQSLLASEQIKDHEFRTVIISMCVMFTGVYLGKGEEALCFARMNYNDYYNRGIITLDTLLAQIGYCYYNLGKSSKYATEKQHFYTKALEYFEKSVEENSNNHLVQYNFGRLLAMTGDIKRAFYHVDQACKLCGAEINFKILRALLYQTQHDNQSALKIISSLLIIKQSALLYFVKASILAEIYLLNLSNDKELQYSKIISQDLMEYTIKKNQKSKDMQSIIQNLKKSLLGFAKQSFEFDQNDQFTLSLPHLKQLQNVEIDPLTYINYRNCIFQTVDILIKVQLFQQAVQALDLIDDGNETNETEKQFYLGLLEEKKEKIDKACQIYEEVLRSDFYHIRAMSRLGLLYLKHQKEQKIQRASELLIAASKFEKTHEVCLGLGILNHLQNNQPEAQTFLNEALRLLKTAPVVSFQMIPDKLFG